MVTLDQAGRGRPWTTVSGAPASLAPWVEHSWIERYPAGLTPALRWKVVPDASPHLLVHDRLGGRSVRVVGPRRVAADFPLGHRRWTVGVRLHPGTLGPLIHDHAGALLDRSAALSELFGTHGRIIEDRIRDAPDAAAVERLLIDFAGTRLHDAAPPDLRVRGLVRGAARRVGDASRALGISPRSLRQVMAREVGLSPSRVLRIRRLFEAIQRGTAPGSVSWSRVAHAVGFADQPHLIREFNDLLGESPERYRARGR